MDCTTNKLEEAVKFYSEHCDYSKGFDFIKKCIESDISNYSKAAVIVYGPHQTRILNDKKYDLTKKLEKNVPWQEKYLNFEDIYSKISSILNPFKGRVSLYDISFRLGIAINILPDSFVYITSLKVINNTKKILGIKSYPGIKRPRTDFPIALQTLESWQIEDFICHVEIEETPSGLIYTIKERPFKPFSNYPSEVIKEIAPIWKEVYNLNLKK